MMTPSQISSQLEFAKSTGSLPAFTAASFRTGVDKNLLLAIASRESHIGQILDGSYLGDGGNGIGLMQVDRRYHPEFAASVRPSDHYKIILKGAQIFKEELNRFDGNTYAALAAYNTGPGDVQKALGRGEDPDIYTTGGDYAKDVLTRYELIKQLNGSSTTQLANMDTIAGLILVSAAAGTVFLMSRNSR